MTRALQVLWERRSDDIPIRQTRRASRGKSDRLADYFSSYYSRTGFTDISIHHLRSFVSNTVRRKATFYCVAYCNGCSISTLMISANLSARSFINIKFQRLIDMYFLFIIIEFYLYVQKSRLFICCCSAEFLLNTRDLFTRCKYFILKLVDKINTKIMINVDRINTVEGIFSFYN